MTYLALVSASDGRRAGFATVAGVALGLAIIGLVAAFGVAEIVQASELLYEGAALGRRPVPALPRLGRLDSRHRCRAAGGANARQLLRARA